MGTAKKTTPSAQHSPGPWSMGHGNTDVIYSGSGTSRREVCTVAPPTKVHPDRPSFADSQLIAAAPDMLAQLKAVVGVFETTGALRDGLSPGSCRAVRETILELVAKAEGSR
jgi:hypothetical protein